jgi:phthiocerol/phenolphthiocerol synthesis type-I polyketide synthase E
VSAESDVESIAIVGMSLRVPGARTVAEFWHNVLHGVESITRFSEDQLRDAGVADATLRRPDYVKASAVLEGIEEFDAGFFGFSPAEAAMLDPQHRLFMECAWEALEDAGHDPFRSSASIGIYGGCFMNKYLPLNLYTNANFLQSSSAYFARNYNDKDFLAGRVAYLMNLRGPAVTVQTACSTSLVATHLATQALLAHDCDIALVGGAAINLPHHVGYLAMEGTMFSPSGRCRPIDMSSDGTLFGSGAGFVVLRRLSDALVDGDQVRAVIRGTAVNNDGVDKVSFTAPNAQAQTAVIASAQGVAGVSPDTIGYIEAHGTGTRLGDPIEVSALTDAFRLGTRRSGYCAIGSVKANIGHLDAAAGVVGLIRATLALQHETIPPQANFESPNPQLNLAQTPFYVPRQAVPWPRGVTPRRAGASSFGVGGTNAHVVLEEAPVRPRTGVSPSAEQPQLLLLSARSEPALRGAADRLAKHLEADEAPPLGSVASTLAEGRREFPVRGFVVAANTQQATAALRVIPPAGALRADGKPQVVYMFPGVGTQYPDMALELYDTQAVFREQVDACADAVLGKLHVGLHRYLFPSRFDGPPIDAESVPDALAAVFAVDYALAKLWMSWGIIPSALMGHSLGEYVAACLAGVLSLHDALDLTVRRGRIFDRIPDGRMMGVAMPAEELQPLLPAGVWLGAVNAPGLSMVSGRQAGLDLLHATLTARGVACRPLPVRMASHSALVEPFLAELEDIVRGYRLSAPRLPYLSCVTGNWIRPEQATDPAYWARQLRAPVLFMAMVRQACAAPNCVFLEVGPGNTLSTLVGAQRLAPAPTAVSSLLRQPGPHGDQRSMLSAAGRLWQWGAAPDWQALRGAAPLQRTPLPTYPFQRSRHWIEPGYPVGPGLVPQVVLAPAPRAADRPMAAPVEPAGTSTVAWSADERHVGDAWKQVLGVASLELDDDFTSLGGHSLMAAQVMMQLRSKYACPLSVTDLYTAPTVRGLAALIAGKASAPQHGEAATAPSLADEVQLDPAIVADGLLRRTEGPPGAVLLTGATGFLGAYLLHELLQQTRATVFCLVRCTDAADGEHRLREHLGRLELPSWSSGRVVVVRGDLAEPLLGLAPEAFAALAVQVDAVHHCGAWVNFARPYATLKAANVLGTQEVLRLAATGRLKPVHHVSTVFVAMGAIQARAEQILEDEPLSAPQGHDTGYTESKWVAEGLCRLAMQRGLPVAVYRPGNILGDTRNGVCNHDDYISKVLQGCTQLGAAPRRDYQLPVGPVDDVARTIVALSLDAGNLGKSHHVIHPDPLPWDRLFEALRTFGHDVPAMSWQRWCALLSEQLKQDSTNALAPLADLLGAPQDRHMPRFGLDNAMSARQRAGLAVPDMGLPYLHRMLDHLTRAGLLPVALRQTEEDAR